MNLGIQTESLSWLTLVPQKNASDLWPSRASLILFSPDRLDQAHHFNELPISGLITERFQQFLQQQLEVGEKLLFNPDQEEWLVITLRPLAAAREFAEQLRWQLADSELLSIQSRALTCSFAVSFYEQPSQVQLAVEELQALLLQAKLMGPDSLLCSLRQPGRPQPTP